LVITIDGEMKVEKVDFETDELVPWLSKTQKKSLQDAIMNAVNKWVKKSQETAQEKMKDIMDQMGINMPNGWLPM
jgi:DNA-binding protein YbaB